MCGIFAYLNYLTEKNRSYILETLLNGLARLEYRGYDSAGSLFFLSNFIGLVINEGEDQLLIIKQVGKVKELRKLVAEAAQKPGFDRPFINHTGMAHTRWATHGVPSQVNSHPHRSDPNNEFTVVHNGIITNYKALKTLLENKGYKFETETDTEIVAKFTKYIFEQHNRKLSFHELIKLVIMELVCLTYFANSFARKVLLHSSSKVSIFPMRLSLRVVALLSLLV